jgi:hypothetical protein
MGPTYIGYLFFIGTPLIMHGHERHDKHRQSQEGSARSDREEGVLGAIARLHACMYWVDFAN